MTAERPAANKAQRVMPVPGVPQQIWGRPAAPASRPLAEARRRAPEAHQIKQPDRSRGRVRRLGQSRLVRGFDPAATTSRSGLTGCLGDQRHDAAPAAVGPQAFAVQHGPPPQTQSTLVPTRHARRHHRPSPGATHDTLRAHSKIQPAIIRLDAGGVRGQDRRRGTIDWRSSANSGPVSSGCPAGSDQSAHGFNAGPPPRLD